MSSDNDDSNDDIDNKEKCKCCKTKLSKYDTCNICGNCKFDDTKTMSETNAKKQYRFTNYDFIIHNIFSFDVYVHRHHGTKYIIKDLDALAKKLISSNNQDYIKRLEKFAKTNASKKVKSERREEIWSFIKNEIENRDDDEICALAYKYIKSTAKTSKLDAIKKKMCEKDKFVTEYNTKRQLFVDAVKDAMNKNTSKTKCAEYIAKLFDIDDNVTKYIVKHLYNKFIEIFYELVDTECKKAYRTIDESVKCLLTTAGSIVKAGYIEKLEKDIRSHRLKMNEMLRKMELEHRFGVVNLFVRSDSATCNAYITHGITKFLIDLGINDANDVVEVAREMNFYYNHTNYLNISRNYYKFSKLEYDYYGFGNTNLSATDVAKRIVAVNLNEEQLKLAPPNVLKLRDDVIASNIAMEVRLTGKPFLDTNDGSNTKKKSKKKSDKKS
jgi:hypothetical protein